MNLFDLKHRHVLLFQVGLNFFYRSALPKLQQVSKVFRRVALYSLTVYMESASCWDLPGMERCASSPFIPLAEVSFQFVLKLLAGAAGGPVHHSSLQFSLVLCSTTCKTLTITIFILGNATPKPKRQHYSVKNLCATGGSRGGVFIDTKRKFIVIF